MEQNIEKKHPSISELKEKILKTLEGNQHIEKNYKTSLEEFSACLHTISKPTDFFNFLLVVYIKFKEANDKIFKPEDWIKYLNRLMVLALSSLNKLIVLESATDDDTVEENKKGVERYYKETKIIFEKYPGLAKSIEINFDELQTHIIPSIRHINNCLKKIIAGKNINEELITNALKTIDDLEKPLKSPENNNKIAESYLNLLRKDCRKVMKFLKDKEGKISDGPISKLATTALPISATQDKVEHTKTSTQETQQTTKKSESPATKRLALDTPEKTADNNTNKKLKSSESPPIANNRYVAQTVKTPRTPKKSNAGVAAMLSKHALEANFPIQANSDQGHGHRETIAKIRTIFEKNETKSENNKTESNEPVLKKS